MGFFYNGNAWFALDTPSWQALTLQGALFLLCGNGQRSNTETATEIFPRVTLVAAEPTPVLPTSLHLPPLFTTQTDYECKVLTPLLTEKKKTLPLSGSSILKVKLLTQPYAQNWWDFPIILYYDSM